MSRTTSILLTQSGSTKGVPDPPESFPNPPDQYPRIPALPRPASWGPGPMMMLSRDSPLSSPRGLRRLIGLSTSAASDHNCGDDRASGGERTRAIKARPARGIYAHNGGAAEGELGDLTWIISLCHRRLEEGGRGQVAAIQGWCRVGGDGRVVAYLVL